MIKSISRFGVLTPITVRRVTDGADEYLLIKGQGRTLACRMLGLDTIPAIVVDSAYADQQKVAQFLVENVARLKMRPSERALLIRNARAQGEETASITERFGVSATTVRRLLTQLESASQAQVAALKSGQVNLALHGVLLKYVATADRDEVLSIIASHEISAPEFAALLQALNWEALTGLGDSFRAERFLLLGWAISTLNAMAPGPVNDRLAALAARLPVTFSSGVAEPAVISS